MAQPTGRWWAGDAGARGAGALAYVWGLLSGASAGPPAPVAALLWVGPSLMARRSGGSRCCRTKDVRAEKYPNLDRPTRIKSLEVGGQEDARK